MVGFLHVWFFFSFFLHFSLSLRVRRLYSGEWTGAVCAADASCGTDVTLSDVKADYDSDLGVYNITGTKRWVTNASGADLFTVFAGVLAPDPSGRLAPAPTAFLVERDGTVQVGPPEKKVRQDPPTNMSLA